MSSLNRSLDDSDRTAVDVEGGGNAIASAPGSELPPLHFRFHWLRPTLYLAFLVFFNVVIPCILYYVLLTYTSIDDKELIGISSAALGVSSCFDAPYRLWKLWRHRDKYGPLHDDSRYHFDLFMWIYTVGLFVFAIPLAVAPAVPLYNFFLFSLPMLIVPMAIPLLLSLRPWRLPIWLSSDAPGTPSKPFIFYFLEDLVAVDFGYGRPWRQELQARWEASPVFRTLIWRQSLYWGVMAALVYPGITAAVIWNTTLHFAFGFVLGLLFIWAISAGIGSFFITRWELKQEKIWWETGHNALLEKRSAELQRDLTIAQPAVVRGTTVRRRSDK